MFIDDLISNRKIGLSSPDRIYDWLERRASEQKPGAFFSHGEIDDRLLERNNSLIDLGLAQFTSSPDVAHKIFKRGDRVMKLAALRNPYACWRLFAEPWASEYVPQFIEDKDAESVAALAANSGLPDSFLERMFKLAGEWSEPSDEVLAGLIEGATHNAKFTQPYDNTFLDGYSEYMDNQVVEAVWELALVVPVGDGWAGRLWTLLARIRRPLELKRRDEMLRRWEFEEPHGSGVGDWSEVNPITHVRSYICTPDEHSSDLAGRLAFYRSIKSLDRETAKRYLERDGDVFYQTIVDIERLWEDQSSRDLLSDIAWDVPDEKGLMNAPNSYRAIEVRHRKRHPEWFVT